MTTLIWVHDSPFSRSIKWLLLANGVEHEDHELSWDDMASDGLLAKFNPKRQVPTLVTNGNAKVDSLLIALDYLPAHWYQTLDAKFFRLADSDVEAAIIFLFRAKQMASRFGESEQSQWMYDAGASTYRFCVDYLLDELLTNAWEVDFGAVLLLSTMLAAISLSDGALGEYRRQELSVFASAVECHPAYLAMANHCDACGVAQVPFQY